MRESERALPGARDDSGENDRDGFPTGPETPVEEEQLETEIEQAEDEGMTDPDVPVPGPHASTPDGRGRGPSVSEVDDAIEADLEDDGLLDG